jgi:predicted ArsR family transcriptional regulator
MLKPLKRTPATASRRRPAVRPASIRDDILRHLPATGGRTLRELARRVKLSSSALRQHLIALERDGLVHRAVVRGRPGRPAFVYRRVTPSVALAPAGPVRLLSALLRVLEAQGPQRVGEAVDAVVAALEGEYGAVGQLADAGARIRAAAAVLFNAEGQA